MKKLQQLVLLLTATLIFTFISCSKDDDSSGGGGVGSGIMTAKIDGTSYKNYKDVGQATLAQSSQGDNLVIQSSNSDGESINLVIWNYTGLGTYNIDSSGVNPNTAFYSETDISNPTHTQIWSAPYQNGEIGTITITEDTDSKVQGEFSFKGKNNGDASLKTITAGKFNLSKVTI